LRVKVQDSQFGQREHNLDRVESHLEILGYNGFTILDEDVRKTVHYLTSVQIFFFVAEELLSFNNSPVLFKLVLCVANVAKAFD
jgi:hypothetical protein